ncbi:hypothetical protein OAQ99_04510 [Candidatus Kapabacteria bacterium]|nr:hypothetical protein [Candidatus Kapabacteria bacterium]
MKVCSWNPGDYLSLFSLIYTIIITIVGYNYINRKNISQNFYYSSIFNQLENLKAELYKFNINFKNQDTLKEFYANRDKLLIDTSDKFSAWFSNFKLINQQYKKITVKNEQIRFSDISSKFMVIRRNIDKIDNEGKYIEFSKEVDSLTTKIDNLLFSLSN